MPDDNAYSRNAYDDCTTPEDLNIKIADQHLSIKWKDGREDEYSLVKLRRQCPCATCRTQRESEQKNPLTILSFNPVETRVINAKLVGNYAIQFFWSDGHDAGIFDFRYLRSLGNST